MHDSPFHFSEAPFKTTPDPKFYYSNQVFKNAWATLRFGIYARKGFIVITGEPGTGKTTLLRRAMRDFGSNIKTAYITDTVVGGTDFLHLTFTDLALGDSSQNLSAITKRLNDYLLEQFEQGNTVALLVDEAQKLSLEGLEELRCLGNLETDRDKLLQIVLAGQPELEQKLDRPELRQLKQRIALRCQLTPITHDEVRAYMDSRLHIIGYRSEDLFEPNAIEKIACYSSGIPRLINIICDNALLAAYSQSARKVTVAMINTVAQNLRLDYYPFDRKEAAKSASGREDESTPRQLLTRITRILGAIVLLSPAGVFFYSHDMGLSASGPQTNVAQDEMTKTTAVKEMAIAKHASTDPSAFQVEKSGQLLHDRKQRPPSKSKELFVIGPSFVRAAPSPNAEIIGTLPPGTRIQVTGPTREYYGVRSRGTTTIRGYVHKEDAFFERKKESRSKRHRKS
jgi:type II secretory pathway predicted ATPase ExeA